jgi:hypothetical protein
MKQKAILDVMLPDFYNNSYKIVLSIDTPSYSSEYDDWSYTTDLLVKKVKHHPIYDIKEIIDAWHQYDIEIHWDSEVITLLELEEDYMQGLIRSALFQKEFDFE